MGQGTILALADVRPRKPVGSCSAAYLPPFSVVTPVLASFRRPIFSPGRRSIRESEPTQFLRTLQVFGATLASASSWARAPEGVGNEPAWFVGKMDGSGNGWSIPDGGDRLVRRHDRLSPNPKIIQAANA